MPNIEDKLNEIYTDLSANITHIYERQNLHLALDLVFHSVLSFKLGNVPIRKGYPEVLIVGDTRCGKTETAEALIRHYKLGQIASGENATRTGLVGAVQQIRNRWTVTWGRIPLNHKRLLIIDELSGLSYDDIGNLSQIRSAGRAEITKVVTEKTQARTRLVWLSNPRRSSTVGNFGSGTELITNLIGKPEDIARFDFAIILANGDVNADIINDPSTAEVEHVHTSELCRNLILWCWSRTPDQVIIPDSTYKACVKYAKLMYSVYSETCPLVNAGEQKVKLARLSTSLACRLFSTDDGLSVKVLPIHVEYMYNFLCYEYNRPKFGYDLWSRKEKENAVSQHSEAIHTLLDDMGGEHISVQLLETRQITSRNIEEIAGCPERSQAITYVALFLKYGALKAYQTYYYKTPGFITILKKYCDGSRVPPTEEY